MRFSGAQTGTRQKAKRPSAWMSHRCQAFNHRPVSADPRHMAHHPHRRGSLPLPQPLRKRLGCKALPHGTDRAQTPWPSCPEPRRGGCIRGCDTLLLQPSWAFKAKSLKPGFANSSKPTPVLCCFPTLGTRVGPSLRPSRPSQVGPTYYSACWCLVCSPLVRSPRKLAAAAAAAAPRVQPPPAPPLRPVGEN